MTEKEKLEYERKLLQKNSSYNLMRGRVGTVAPAEYTPSAIEGVNDLSDYLRTHGGYHQQERMIIDKRKTLDRALLYSYQGAIVKKLLDSEEANEPVRALINPDKNKLNYDDKIISVGFEHGFKPGDVFEWVNTDSYWIVYLQDLTELAYFRGEIRKCSHKISWYDKDAEKQCETYVAIRGPVETQILSIQKMNDRFDVPNYSIYMIVPKTEDNLKKFVRYSKFYLENCSTCWEVTAADAISSPGVITLTAVEEYGNPHEEDGPVVSPLALERPTNIIGEGFIKVKQEYIYSYNGLEAGGWRAVGINGQKVPVKLEAFFDEDKNRAVKVKWDSTYSGQFDLQFVSKSNKIIDNKSIIVESLF